jgi:hypothetical protein
MGFRYSRENFNTAKDICRSIIEVMDVTEEHIDTLNKSSAEVIQLVFLHLGEEPSLHVQRADMKSEPLFTVFTDKLFFESEVIQKALRKYKNSNADDYQRAWELAKAEE